MWGQWIGRATGSNTGFITINIDEASPNVGRLFFNDFDPQKPSFVCDIKVKKNDDSQLFEAVLNNFELNDPYVPPQKTKAYKDALPNRSTIKGTKNGYKISGDWFSDNTQTGQFILNSEEDYNAGKPDEIMKWSDFIKFSLDLKREQPGIIFRGMEYSTHALKTSFHRYGRRDLIAYLKDIETLSHHFTSYLGRSFDLSNSNENTEVIFLGQHHGFPTPFLDWTESPFVASYFAFHKHQKNTKEKGYARVLCFNKSLWEMKYKPATSLVGLEPTFAPLVVTSRDNSRAIPQQSLVTFSNMYNIEGWIRYCEQQDNESYLKIYDIDLSERDKVMKDLEAMGITASTLFPGLDGISQYLREKRF